MITFDDILRDIIKATKNGAAVWNSGGEIYTLDTGKYLFSLWPDNTVRVQTKNDNEVVTKISQNEPEGEKIPALRNAIEANRDKVLNQIIDYFK